MVNAWPASRRVSQQSLGDVALLAQDRTLTCVGQLPASRATCMTSFRQWAFRTGIYEDR
jgi:hypothetical protein